METGEGLKGSQGPTCLTALLFLKWEIPNGHGVGSSWVTGEEGARVGFTEDFRPEGRRQGQLVAGQMGQVRLLDTVSCQRL